MGFLQKLKNKIQQYALGRLLIAGVKLFFKREFISLGMQEVLNLIPKHVLEQMKQSKHEELFAHHTKAQAIFFSPKKVISPPPLVH